MSVDGSTLDVPDEKVNADAFGYAQGARGEAAYPQIRFVALAECATHALCRVQMGGVRDDSEQALARQLVPAFSDDMLVLADRLFYGYDMWREAVATGAKLLWRVKSNLRLPCEVPLADGTVGGRYLLVGRIDHAGIDGAVEQFGRDRTDSSTAARPNGANATFDIAELNTTCSLTPEWTLGFAYIFNRVGVSDDGITWFHQINLGANYALSKRTTLLGAVVWHKRLGHALQVAQALQAQRDNRRASGSPSRTNRGEPVRPKARRPGTRKPREVTPISRPKSR
jgi:hypothetical protein